MEDEGINIMFEMKKESGCVLPSVKHQTCREHAVALLAQEKEHDCTCNVQLVKDLEERLSGMVNMAVDRELQLQDSQQESVSKDREICTLQYELSKLQEKRREYHQDRRDAEEKIRCLQETVKSLEDTHINMVKMAIMDGAGARGASAGEEIKR